MFKFFKKCKHEYISVLRTYDVFNTYYTDTKERKYWSAHFRKCKHCNHRIFETNYDSGSVHSGMDQAKAKWLESGIILDAVKYHKKEDPIPKPTINNVQVSDKVAKLLLKALSTSSESEAQNCFKLARREFNATKS